MTSEARTHGRMKKWGSRTATGVMLFIIAAGSAYPQVSAQRREVSGRAASEREALEDALQNAAFQICGANVKSETSSKISVSVRGDSVEIVEGINRQIKLSTGQDECRLAGYEVLAVERDGSDVGVRVQVTYSTYRVPGPAVERRRLAVLDFGLDEVRLYGSGGRREQRSGGRMVRRGVALDYDLIRNLQERFQARIEELLVQGRRFAVLDRRSPEVYEREKELLQSADVDPAEAARVGKVMGADYLLYGTLDGLAVEEERKEITLTGERRKRVIGSVRVRFAVLAVATRQVKWSSSLELERIVAEDLRPEQVGEELLDELAIHIVDELTENIYPPAVAQVVASGRFVVNRGGNTVAAGDEFQVFAVGEPIVDPDTGESLGRIEDLVGIARIIEVKPKYSVAEMISASTDVSFGMLLRRYHGLISADSEARFTDGGASGGGATRNYRRVDGDRDRDGLPDYLNRDAQTGDGDKDGLPDYLNRDNLRRR